MSWYEHTTAGLPQPMSDAKSKRYSAGSHPVDSTTNQYQPVKPHSNDTLHSNFSQLSLPILQAPKPFFHSSPSSYHSFEDSMNEITSSMTISPLHQSAHISHLHPPKPSIPSIEDICVPVSIPLPSLDTRPTTLPTHMHASNTNCSPLTPNAIHQHHLYRPGMASIHHSTPAPLHRVEVDSPLSSLSTSPRGMTRSLKSKSSPTVSKSKRDRSRGTSHQEHPLSVTHTIKPIRSAPSLAKAQTKPRRRSRRFSGSSCRERFSQARDFVLSTLSPLPAGLDGVLNVCSDNPSFQAVQWRGIAHWIKRHRSSMAAQLILTHVKEHRLIPPDQMALLE